MMKDIIKKHSYSSYRLGGHSEFVLALLDVKVACARANAHSQSITSEAANKIEKSCEILKKKINEEILPVDIYQGGGGIAVHLNINMAIESMNQGVPIAEINASQSTADVCASALRILLQRQWLVFEKTLNESLSLFSMKAKEFSSIQTLSRTCLQDALPTQLGYKFSSYAFNIQRRIESLQDCLKNLGEISLGGTVIGTGDGASQAYRDAVPDILKQVTGLPLQRRANYVDAAQNIDEIAALSHELSLLAENLIKISKDLRLLHSGPEGGFAEITIPQAMQGSSFFAEKNNPTVVETLLQCCFHVMGMHRTVTACLEHGELDLNTFELMAGLQTQQSMVYLQKALANLNQFALKGISANPERCAQLSTKARGHKNGITTRET